MFWIFLFDKVPQSAFRVFQGFVCGGQTTKETASKSPLAERSPLRRDGSKVKNPCIIQKPVFRSKKPWFYIKKQVFRILRYPVSSKSTIRPIRTFETGKVREGPLDFFRKKLLKRAAGLRSLQSHSWKSAR